MYQRGVVPYMYIYIMVQNGYQVICKIVNDL